MRVNRKITPKTFTFIMLLLTVASFRIRDIRAAGPFRVSAVDDHHLVQIGSNQPYVAGFHVHAGDFYNYGTIDGATATVAFQSTNFTYFPTGAWLGAGLFLQAQDHRYLFIDYGFYMIVALDSAGNLFVDIGLHQTMEGSLPLQSRGSSLVYAYTWQLLGIEPSTMITLFARWTTEGLLNYSIKTEKAELLIKTIKVSEFSGCENIIPQFYKGNIVGQLFPFGRCVNFFQFGVTGSRAIANNQWTVLLENPMYLKQDKWIVPEKAWSTQGDHSYLDHDATWGGEPYPGVYVHHFMDSERNVDALIFSYQNRTLEPGTVLWDYSQANSNDSLLAHTDSFQAFLAQLTIWCMLPMTLALIVASYIRKHPNVRHSENLGNHETIGDHVPITVPCFSTMLPESPY